MQATRQHKRLRRKNAGSSSDNSKSSDDEIQEIDVLGNICDKETEDKIPSGGKPSSGRTYAVSAKTKCWLFLKNLRKVLKIIFELLFLCI